MSAAPPRLVTALEGRYDLGAVVGQGGMATVYRATDLKHDRAVAIKVVRPELSLATDRFLQEIRVTAGLQHPGIVPLYDSGEADGLLYYVMPLVAGETLRMRLEREGKLPLVEALRIGRAVASTIAWAHERGVVHRDIKPENILFAGEQPLVADFGIARALSAAGHERLTSVGESLGSPAYMSPEQSTGEHDVDERADIYSLGCVLYEMISGDPPFRGTAIQVIAKRLVEPPPTLAGVPPDVATTVRHAMATQPADRFATAAELAKVLVEITRRGDSDTAPPEGASIVVLPLENLSPDPDNAYFADGLTDEIISDLSHVSDLRVISRTSAMRYKETTKALPEIARELSVRYVLQGSVRRAGNAIRVTSQLIDARSDDHLWSGKFGGTLDDVFEIQESISRRIVDALAETLSTGAAEQLPEKRQEDPRVMDLYLKVQHAIWQFNPESLRLAEHLLDGGVDMLGEHPLLIAARASVLYQGMNMGLDVDQARVDEAERLARRALELDPDCAQAWGVLGWLYSSRHNLGDGLPALRRARELAPSDSSVTAGFIFVAGMTEGLTGDELAAIVEGLLARDPFMPLAQVTAWLVPYFQGRFEDSLLPARQAAKLDSSNVYAMFSALSLIELGRTDDAIRELGPLAEIEERGLWGRLAACLRHGLLGDAAAIHALVDDEFQAWAKPDVQYTWNTAQAFALAGDLGASLDWLEHGVATGFSPVDFLRNHERIFEPLRGHPRFEAALEIAEEKRAAVRAALAART